LKVKYFFCNQRAEKAESKYQQSANKSFSYLIPDFISCFNLAWPRYDTSLKRVELTQKINYSKIILICHKI